MATQEIRKGDIGTIFEMTIKDEDGVVNLTGYTTIEIIFQTPEEIKTFPAVLSGLAINGKIKYTTIDANVLDVIGRWKWQGHVVLGSGDWKTTILPFTVHENIE
jgi:hypothetical protein